MWIALFIWKSFLIIISFILNRLPNYFMIAIAVAAIVVVVSVAVGCLFFVNIILIVCVMIIFILRFVQHFVYFWYYFIYWVEQIMFCIWKFSSGLFKTKTKIETCLVDLFCGNKMINTANFYFVEKSLQWNVCAVLQIRGLMKMFQSFLFIWPFLPFT